VITCPSVTPEADDADVGPNERPGLITIRVWLHHQGLVARVTLARDPNDVLHEYIVTSAEEVQRLVVDWLRGFQSE
jgi:hypothetical protein